MTDKESVDERGAVATRPEDGPPGPPRPPVFSPLDFRLNLGARLADLAEPLLNLDNPAIRKLTWDHVVPGQPGSPAPNVATSLAAPIVCVDHKANPLDEPVKAVVNTLAAIPDLVVDDSPIELRIASSGPVTAQVPSVYAPVLANARYVEPTRPTTAAVAVIAARETSSRRPVRKKPKRHIFRTFLTLVLLFGLLAGGAFVAKKYLLDQPAWSVELKPLAEDVATTRGLQFKVAVVVSELPIADYAARLAGSSVDALTDHAPAWRALGLLNGELDLEAIGRQAMNDSPTFYDPATKTIFVTQDLKAYEHLYRFALRRALTAALLDQHFDWSSRLTTASPAAALAIRSTIDGDALAVANTLAATDAPDQLAPELFTFVQGHGGAPAPSQYAVALAGRTGVVMRPTIAAMGDDPVALAALEKVIPGSDVVLDVARTEVAGPSPVGTLGMMFWYYVLASRIDDGQAWAAAVRWTGDSLAISTGGAAQCVQGTVAAADAEGAAVLLGAFQSWAAAASVESTTSVAAIDGNQVTIRACDPGAAVTALLPPKVPVVFGGAAVERSLVQAATAAAAGTKVDAACLVDAARLRSTVLTSPADDSPVLAVGWQSTYAAANVDLATACVAAGG